MTAILYKRVPSMSRWEVLIFYLPPSQFLGPHHLESNAYASLLHVRGVTRRSAGGIFVGVACRPEGRRRVRQSGALAPSAGLWARRADEDRNGHSPRAFRSSPRNNDRFANCSLAGKQGLEELAGIPPHWRKGSCET